MTTGSLTLNNEPAEQGATTVSGMMDFAPGIEGAFPSRFEEGDGRLECIAGQVPEFVRGTYYLNGPALFRSGMVSYNHWLDGDGMVSRLRFAANGLHFRNRYIRSSKF